MFKRTQKLVLACMLLSGCAITPPSGIVSASLHGPTMGDRASRSATDASARTSEGTGQDRFRFVDQREDGLKSVLLVPTAVDALVAVGPLARSRVFVGALFASQRIGGDRVAAVGLVIKAVGGGLGASLAVLPRVVVEVDGEELLRSSVARSGLYSVKRGAWGPEETLTFRVQPEIVRAMARANDVQLRLGDLVIFDLDETQIADLAAFLEQIPEDTRFELRHELATAPGSRAQ